jgi:hypothetical protein
VSINLNDLNPQSRQYVESIAQQELAAQKRVRKTGSWCWFCGGDSKLVKCECLYPESFGCRLHNICAECARAHCKIANHIRGMLKFPRVNRSDSRRYGAFRVLRRAAEEIEEPMIDSGKLDVTDALHCRIVPDENEPYECSTEELRSAVLGGFRSSRFTRYQELEISLNNEITKSMLTSVSRFLRSCR